MTIEQLTDEERGRIEDMLFEATRFDKPALEKALRIIDAHAADRAALVAKLEAAEAEAKRCAAGWDATAPAHAALVAQVAELTRERDEARATNLTWLAKYNAQRGELAGVRDEVTRLTEALAAASRQRDDLARVAMGRASAASYQAESERADVLQRRAEAAESECAALRAEVACIRAESELTETRLAEMRHARDTAESRLAAANALLEQCLDELYRDGGCSLTRAISAHLAAQPATAPARDRPGVPRTRFVAGVDGLARAQSQPTTAPVVGCVDHVEFQKTGFCRLCGEPAQNKAEIDPYIVQPATAPARGDVLSDGTWIRTPEEERSAAECRGCREGSEHHHTCQRAVIPPQTYLPPSVLRSLQKKDEDNE